MTTLARVAPTPQEADETSSVTWGATRLTYAIRRSSRRKKTVAVTVDPAGRVLLVAPESFATSRLDAVVRRKAPWIVRRLRGAQTHDPHPPEREFVSGESVLYLGRHYRLKVHPQDSPVASGTKLRGGWLHVSRPPARSGRTRSERPSSPGSGATPPSACPNASRRGSRGPASQRPA